MGAAALVWLLAAAAIIITTVLHEAGHAIDDGNLAPDWRLKDEHDPNDYGSRYTRIEHGGVILEQSTRGVSPGTITLYSKALKNEVTQPWTPDERVHGTYVPHDHNANGHGVQVLVLSWVGILTLLVFTARPVMALAAFAAVLHLGGVFGVQADYHADWAGHAIEALAAALALTAPIHLASKAPPRNTLHGEHGGY